MCEFDGCENEQAGYAGKTGIRLCALHEAQVVALIKATPFDPAALVAWHIKARGGAEKYARVIADDMARDLRAFPTDPKLTAEQQKLAAAILKMFGEG